MEKLCSKQQKIAQGNLTGAEKYHEKSHKGHKT
jgi:hypothetical protein